MSQIAANPWTFLNADQASTVAITSIVNQGASILVTTTGAHGLLANAAVSIQGTTITGYRGGYKVLAVPSATTLLLPFNPGSGLANNGANGNVLSAAYLDKIRCEQAVWSKTAAGTQLTLTDIAGNNIWEPHCTTADAVYTYGKVFWVNGLVINALPGDSVLQMTIN